MEQGIGADLFFQKNWGSYVKIIDHFAHKHPFVKTFIYG